MELYLIRHAESEVNIRMDLPRAALDAGLTKQGQRQARALARWLPREVVQVDALYASTMKRARETVAYLAKAYKREIVFDDRLREIGNNHRDGSPVPGDALPNQYSSQSTFSFPFTPVAPMIENSETAMDFRARVGRFLDELILNHARETVVVVTHGGTINAVADAVFNVGTYRRSDLRLQNTSVSRFEYRGPNEWETWRIYYIGRVDHLARLGPAAQS